MDIHSLSANLLERIANSIHDREPDNKCFCFTSAEVFVVENWIAEISGYKRIEPQSGSSSMESNDNKD